MSLLTTKYFTPDQQMSLITFLISRLCHKRYLSNKEVYLYMSSSEARGVCVWSWRRDRSQGRTRSRTEPSTSCCAGVSRRRILERCVLPVSNGEYFLIHFNCKWGSLFVKIYIHINMWRNNYVHRFTKIKLIIWYVC